MPIQNYSVLKGKPTGGKVVSGKGTHYQITVQGTSDLYTVAVNIESTDGSEVLFSIEHAFTPPDMRGLAALPTGMTRLQSRPNGLALDFVREQIDGRPMITQAGLTLLPKNVSTSGPNDLDTRESRESLSLSAKALSNAVTALISQAIADGNATLFAFGSAYADSGKVDGIHDIHMNQGNPVSRGHARDNGIWQDGALFLRMPNLNPDPSQNWVAVFIAFQTELWNTDENGNPI
jgi:uncharacterized protein YukJ